MSMFIHSRKVRIVFVATTGIIIISAAAAAVGSNWTVGFLINAIAGIIIASLLFVVLSIVARRAADERVLLANSNRTPRWRERSNQTLGFKHKDSGLYADWYFRLRLQEEIDRCARYGTQVTVLLAKREGGGWQESDVRSRLRRSDLPALLRDGTLGVVLPNTARDAALHARITTALTLEQARVGLACYPEDGADASALLGAADAAAGSLRFAA